MENGYYLKLIQPEANEQVRNYYARIKQQVHIAYKITTDLLGFARNNSMEQKPVAIPNLVQRVS